MRTPLLVLALLALVLAGCASDDNPLRPSSHGASVTRAGAAAPTAAKPGAGKPAYEPAYVDGQTVTITAIDFKSQNRPAARAQADLYLVVYPTNWQSEGIPAPQCNPCDHDQNGIDALDFHDHVLDSQPGDPGYRAPWHVFAVVPAYNGDPAHDAAIDAVYEQVLPLKSEAEVDALLARTLPGDGPVAIEVDTGVVFICAVVNAHAMK